MTTDLKSSLLTDGGECPYELVFLLMVAEQVAGSS